MMWERSYCIRVIRTTVRNAYTTQKVAAQVRNMLKTAIVSSAYGITVHTNERGRKMINGELIIDNFAGGGGAAQGLNWQPE